MLNGVKRMVKKLYDNFFIYIFNLHLPHISCRQTERFLHLLVQYIQSIYRILRILRRN